MSDKNMIKKCSRCKQKLSIAAFAKNRTRQDGYAGTCKACMCVYQQRYYTRNSTYYKQHARDTDLRNARWLREYKSKLCCELCGETHPACIQFHHVDPSKKIIDIATAVRRGWTIERLKKELELCVPYCANCHAKHHWDERQKSED